MKVAGTGKLVGFRQGTKNGKRWGNVFIDDHANLMERIQLFVRADDVSAVESLPIGCDVDVVMRVYSVDNGRAHSAQLEAIVQKK